MPTDTTKIAADGAELAPDATDWVAVRDDTTGLTWSRANIRDKRLTHKQAIKACAALNLAGHSDWRLPTIRELLTLVDYGRYNPAIDIDLFPECKANWYWSVTPYAPSPGGCAWSVSFYDGGADWGFRGYGGFVRAVRASECQGVTFRELHAAWLEARRGKTPSRDRLEFEQAWIDGLLDLQQLLNAHRWQPAPPTCFIATRPKAREIHAPAFADRVVHHWLVPVLEQLYEPAFIFDSFSNRRDKGTHAAVDRLQGFARQIGSGQGGGWYLQLDIRNFFNSISRPILWRQLRQRLARSELDETFCRAVHALLRHSPLHRGVRYACRPDERALVPAHKRLANAAPGCGIAIGNLSSQFFANVYLNALDQHVKHALKVRRYVRYVDDFVIVDADRERLVAIKSAIERFLHDHLRLALKADVRLKPLTSGIDFLGYVIWPTHRVARRRVVAHCREKLSRWQRRHVRGRRLMGRPSDFAAVRSVWQSYLGHLSHANSKRLIGRLHDEFPWLRRATAKTTFDYRLEGRTVVLLASSQP